MITQKCIVTLEDGSRIIFYGPPQYDTDKKPRIRKTSFSVPKDDSIGDDAFENLMKALGMK